MTNWKMAVVLVAMTGCAGAGSLPTPKEELSSGLWDGSIGRDGWSRPLYLDLERDSGAWHGKWRGAVAGPSMALKDFEVRGDEVRFETDRFRFIGHVMGDTLEGTVVEVPAGTPAGDFSVTRQDPYRFVD